MGFDMKKTLKAFKHAFEGIIYTFKTQKNAKIELFFTVIAIS